MQLFAFPIYSRLRITIEERIECNKYSRGKNLAIVKIDSLIVWKDI
jgi:hypothetical protein